MSRYLHVPIHVNGVTTSNYHSDNINLTDVLLGLGTCTITHYKKCRFLLFSKTREPNGTSSFTNTNTFFIIKIHVCNIHQITN